MASAPLRTVGLALALWLWGLRLGAQVLEPRLYQNAPLGLNAIAVGYTYSSGNVQFCVVRGFGRPGLWLATNLGYGTGGKTLSASAWGPTTTYSACCTSSRG